MTTRARATRTTTTTKRNEAAYEAKYMCPGGDGRRGYRAGMEGGAAHLGVDADEGGVRAAVRGLHSSTFQINVSTFRGVRCVISVTKTAQVEPKSGGVEAPTGSSRAAAGA